MAAIDGGRSARLARLEEMRRDLETMNADGGYEIPDQFARDVRRGDQFVRDVRRAEIARVFHLPTRMLPGLRDFDLLKAES